MNPSETDFDPSTTSPSPGEEFARLFARYHRVLFGYLMMSLGNTNDAEEVLQETCAVLWREQHHFVLGTNFVNWATTIAQNQVRKFRRERERHRLLPDDELLDQIAVESVARADLFEARRTALNLCLERLSDSDRRLVSAAYSSDSSKKAVAEQMGRPINTVYKALNRIRQQLLECIERRMATEERS